MRKSGVNVRVSREFARKLRLLNKKLREKTGKPITLTQTSYIISKDINVNKVDLMKKRRKK